jgi:hypothetical protein
VREYQLAAAAHAVLDGGGQVHLLMIGSTSMRDPRLIFPIRIRPSACCATAISSCPNLR